MTAQSEIVRLADLAPRIFGRKGYSVNEELERAIDTLSLAANLTLHDSLRPGKIHNYTMLLGENWHVEERDFALFVRSQQITPPQPQWLYTPAILRRLEHGSYEKQFNLALPDRRLTLAWVVLSDHVVCKRVDKDSAESDAYLSPADIRSLAGLLLSPMFTSYDPETETHEAAMPSPDPNEVSRYPIPMSEEEVILAYNGIASYLISA